MIYLCGANTKSRTGAIPGLIFNVWKNTDSYLNFGDKRGKHSTIINIMTYKVFKKEIPLSKKE